MLPGIGWSELFVLAVLALIVIGPKDLPRVMRAFGRMVGKARAMAREFQTSFEEIAREAEMEEMRKEAEKLRAAIAPPEVATPLTPEQQDRFIAEHNAKILEAQAGASVPAEPLEAGGPSEPEPALAGDTMTPIRALR
jgi:sec-independent protein translocase protein TatB